MSREHLKDRICALLGYTEDALREAGNAGKIVAVGTAAYVHVQHRSGDSTALDRAALHFINTTFSRLSLPDSKRNEAYGVYLNMRVEEEPMDLSSSDPESPPAADGPESAPSADGPPAADEPQSAPASPLPDLTLEFMPDHPEDVLAGVSS